jgi:hypothetical protein
MILPLIISFTSGADDAHFTRHALVFRLSHAEERMHFIYVSYIDLIMILCRFNVKEPLFISITLATYYDRAVNAMALCAAYGHAGPQRTRRNKKKKSTNRKDTISETKLAQRISRTQYQSNYGPRILAIKLIVGDTFHTKCEYRWGQFWLTDFHRALGRRHMRRQISAKLDTENSGIRFEIN